MAGRSTLGLVLLCGCSAPSSGRDARLPDTASFIDTSTGESTEEPTELVRLSSVAAHPDLAPNALPTFVYLYRSPDGEVVMLNGGYFRWVTGGTLSEPIFEPTSLASDLDDAANVLLQGHRLSDIAAAYVEHGHPDHMDVSPAANGRTSALPVWAGSGDRGMIESIPDTSSAGADRETCWSSPTLTVPPDYIPALTAPAFEVHYVDTSAATTGPGDWIDGGHGVRLAAVPSHTPGSLMIALPDAGVAIVNNHLLSPVLDCPDLENSPCFVDCGLYAQSKGGLPTALVLLPVHPL